MLSVTDQSAKELIDLKEDTLLYEHLSKTLPEGKQKLDAKEKDDFENWLQTRGTWSKIGYGNNKLLKAIDRQF